MAISWLRAPRVIPATALGRVRLSVAFGVAIVVVGTAALAAPRVPTSPTPVSTRLQHSRVLSYPAEQVWPTTLRYLRVDRDYVLIDRDREAGFILFDFPLGTTETKGRGSIELMTTVDPAGRPAVKLNVSTDAGPTHLPHAIAEGLAAKLRAERGQPAPPPRPQPAPPPPDEDDDQPWAELPPENDGL